jgi:hypothetical protein
MGTTMTMITLVVLVMMAPAPMAVPIIAVVMMVGASPVPIRVPVGALHPDWPRPIHYRRRGYHHGCRVHDHRRRCDDHRRRVPGTPMPMDTRIPACAESGRARVARPKTAPTATRRRSVLVRCMLYVLLLWQTTLAVIVPTLMICSRWREIKYQ